MGANGTSHAGSESGESGTPSTSGACATGETGGKPTMSGTLRRDVLRAAGAGALAAALAACASQGSPAVPAVGKEAVKIGFATDWSSGARLENVKQALAIWQQKYPNVAVDLRVGGGGVEEKIVAEIAAGTQADVVLYTETGVAALRQHFVDLMPFIKRDKFDMRDWLAVPPALLFQGGQYGMPFQRNSNCWFVNKTLFQREGVALPTDKWTWDDMAEAARKLTKPGQQWGLEVSPGQLNNSRDTLGGLLWSNGGDLVSKDGKHTTIATPEALEAGRWIYDRLHRDRSMLKDDDERKANLAPGHNFVFQSGKVGVAGLNVGWVGTLEASIGFSQFEWDVMWTPKAPRTGKALTFIGDQPHAMTKPPGRTAAQTDAAWAFTAFMSGPDVMALLAEGRTSIPVHRAVLQSERYLRRPPASTPIIPKLVDATMRFDVPWFPALADWRAAINKKLVEAWTGKVQIDDALRAGAADGDAVLARQ
jgi:ABC-type glycerol-3-phosphate transport system substrate-binding protein